MAQVAGDEVVISRGDGVWVWDENGSRYLDASAGLWHTNIGHGRHEIASAVTRQLETLATHHTFGEYANRPALELAERLTSLAPDSQSRVFFGSGGGDGIDTAAKLARLYWTTEGKPQRRHILTRATGYHGTHGFGTSLSGWASYREGFGPLIPDTSTVDHASTDALAAAIEEIGPDSVGAFLFEPVMASAGCVPPPPGYLDVVAELCRSYDILMIADAVVCGFGRLGTWYGVERWNLDPDMIVFAKGVTSGYLPLGGVIVNSRVSEPFWAKERSIEFRHGPTYSGHATCCAAALANLQVMEDEGLLTRSVELEGSLEAALLPLRDHPLVETVRAGTGLMGALIFREELVAQHDGLSLAGLAAAREAGVLTRALANGLAVSPPLVITETEIELIGQGLRDALDRLEASLPEPVAAGP
jgi:putrescine---pyruvate transaminase